MDMPPALYASRKAAFHIMHTRNCSISWYYTTFGWSIIEEKNICLFFTANQLFWPENGKSMYYALSEQAAKHIQEGKFLL